MAFGVETRLPYLDYRLEEALFRLPIEEKMHGGELKALLREAARAWVPGDITERFSKQGYPAPLHRWLRSLGSDLLEVAHSQAARECPLVRPVGWQREGKRFLQDERRPLEAVWRGLVCVLWYEEIFKRDFSKDLQRNRL
jgi:asparagine synthase (glutamine-hydrolysing)